MKARTQGRLRKWHQCVGLFLAPMLLLLAVSGAFQVFRLNSEKGWGSPPPRCLMIIAAVHKNQAMPHVDAPPPLQSARVAAPDRPSSARDPVAAQPSPVPLQIFVTLASMGLIASTSFGIAIALAGRTKRRMNLGIIVAGVIIPAVLLFV